MLGIPTPAGPVLLRAGRKWAPLDDSRFLETPASVQLARRWLLLTYEGRSPQLVDLGTGRALLDEEDRRGWSGARLVAR